MLLLFASCLNCSVHGAFLFCGEKLLQFIVKYKAVSVRFGGDRGTSHLPARRTPGSRLALQKVLENGDIWECCDPGNSPRCGTDSVGVQHWPLGDVSGWALCLFMKIIILIKFIFFFFFWWTNSKLLFRMKFVEGESGRTNHVYCHIEKGNLIIFCKMYFWLAYIYMWSADPADGDNF